MKTILLPILVMATMNSFAQSDFDRSTDKESGATVFKGQITFEDLLKESSFSWMGKGISDYNPDKDAILYLQKELPNYEVVIFIGTWCDDSKSNVPKLYKTLQAANYPMRRYSLYGVDRAKTTKYVEHKLYKIELVPTIILIKKNNEIGRIVEQPKKSIEQDLVDLIKADKKING